MALHVQNINHSAFRLMFEREKLSGTNFNDWFRQLRLVLGVKKKLFVIEQPLPAAPTADSEEQVWTATPQVTMIQGGRIQKANKKSLNAKGKGKGKGKGKDNPVYILKPKNPKPSAKEHLAKDDTYHHCKEVGNKRAKNNLDSTYLWHHRLAHISKKRIKKLQHDGLLKSTNEESFDKCVSCLSGKMTRKLFPHRTEKANDLLE
nr:retrotransposon protein, putative, Ty1-copia subclass [Tanacetum cinerariifolium]